MPYGCFNGYQFSKSLYWKTMNEWNNESKESIKLVKIIQIFPEHWKTNFMIFKNKHSNKPELNFKIEINDRNIDKVEVTKFLGILIDNHLSWKSHIIRKIRPYLTSIPFILYITPLFYLIYLIALLCGEIKIILTLNHFSYYKKKVIGTCTNSLWLEYKTPIFNRPKKTKIRDLYIYQLAIHMFRYHSNLLPFRSPFNLVHQPIGYALLYYYYKVIRFHFSQPINWLR